MKNKNTNLKLKIIRKKKNECFCKIIQKHANTNTICKMVLSKLLLINFYLFPSNNIIIKIRYIQQILYRKLRQGEQ